MHGVLLQQLVVAPHPAPPSTKPSRNGEHIHRRPPATYNLADLWITWRRRPMSVENAEVIDIMVLSDDHTQWGSPRTVDIESGLAERMFTWRLQEDHSRRSTGLRPLIG